MGFDFLKSNNGGSSSGTKYLPAMKWDAKYGHLVMVVRTPSEETGKWESNDEIVSKPVKLVFDLGGTQHGWIKFKPYSSELRPLDQPRPAQPSTEHNEAVRIRVMHKEFGLREFTPTSRTVMRALSDLHDEYIAKLKGNEGKFPVVEITDSDKIKVNTPQGALTFHAPVMKITGWVAPPKEFLEAESTAPTVADAPLDDDIEF